MNERQKRILKNEKREKNIMKKVNKGKRKRRKMNEIEWKKKKAIEINRFGLVSLFKSISTFKGYLIAKPSL